MNMKKMFLILFIIFACTGTAFADVYNICAYAVDWEGVEPINCPKQSVTEYVDDIVRGFFRGAVHWGQNGYEYQQNNNVWPDFAPEDAYPFPIQGLDFIAVDLCEFTFFGGHGATVCDGPCNTDVNHYFIGALSRNEGSGCYFYSDQMKLGEKQGPWSIPNPGHSKVLSLFSCQSLQLEWIQHWSKRNVNIIPNTNPSGAFQGLHFITGFTGDAWSSYFNDSFGGTFAEELFSKEHSIKRGWFYANQEKWIHNTAVVYTAGLNCDDAAWRLDHEPYSYYIDPFPPGC